MRGWGWRQMIKVMNSSFGLKRILLQIRNIFVGDKKEFPHVKNSRFDRGHCRTDTRFRGGGEEKCVVDFISFRVRLSG